MSARGEVFLGDLAKALSLLRPRDRRTAEAMAELLELDRGPGSDPGSGSGAGSGSGSGSGSGARAGHGPGGRGVRDAADPVSSGPYASGRRYSGDGGPRTQRDAGPASGQDPAANSGPEARPGLGTGAAPAPSVPSIPAPAAGVQAPRLTERSLDFSLTPAESPPRERVPGLLADALSSAVGAPADPVHPDGRSGPDSLSSSPTSPLSSPLASSLPAYEPPWTPEWARGVMFAAVSTTVASRRLDERTLSRKTARQEGLRAVPWQRRPTTRRGVQLLLDHGAGMVPFQDDRRWLRELAGSIAGRDRVETLRFQGSPLRGVVRNDPADPRPYRPPAPGTPVVLVSELGRVRPPFAGDPGVPAYDWLDFVHRLVRSGCPAVCLTPYDAAEYPQALRDRIALIPFDRRISLRHAQEALRRIRQATEARS